MIYHVFANRSNAGDWLSARGIQQLLGNPGVVELLCDEPFVSETTAALARADRSDLVIIGGGGLFMDYFAPFWRAFAELAPRPRFVVWGVGYVDLKALRSTIDPSDLRPILGHAEMVVPRDDMTSRLLNMAGLSDPVPCPSLAALSREPGRGLGLLHSANLTTVGSAAYATMVEIGNRFARSTGRPYRETNNRFEDGEAGLERTVGLYRSSDVVLTSRLHGCLIAMALGRPVVAVSGDSKIESTMNAAGLEDWTVDGSEAHRALDLLADSSRQPSTEGYVSESRAANAAVAATVADLAGLTPVRPA